MYLCTYIYMRIHIFIEMLLQTLWLHHVGLDMGSPLRREPPAGAGAKAVVAQRSFLELAVAEDGSEPQAAAGGGSWFCS